MLTLWWMHRGIMKVKCELIMNALGMRDDCQGEIANADDLMHHNSSHPL